MDLTKDDLSLALQELGALAQQEGLVIDLAIYGGACLMMVSNFRVGTRDVDAVAASDQGAVDRLAGRIAASRGWDPRWLNDGVRTYMSPSVEPPAQHQFLRAYPSEQTPGLRIFVPTPEYLLAMKLMSLRIAPEEGAKDLNDILSLLPIVGLQRKEDIVAFAAGFYPEARTSAKLRLAIDELWRLYEERRRRPGDEAPSYLGRSGPPL
jgi:hypothetical protein